MKNTVEEAKNFSNASVPSGIAARQAREDHSSNGAAAFSSRFTILKQVGATASAQVYLARENHNRSADLVILKVLHQDAVKDPTELVSFLLESRAAARLAHENIIKARVAEQIGNTHFYTVEHKAGAETLRELLDQRGWLEIDQAIGLANQLADAFKFAHEAGILHLEVEPSKILLDSDGRVTLMGFGVDARKQFEWAHRKRSSNCSFAYLSPEQLDNGVLDQRSDLYSLGVTLYEVLTDRLPFNAESAGQIKQKIATQKAQPPHLLRSDVPDALSIIVTRLISKNPAERFQDAASLKDALAGLLNPVSHPLPRQTQPSQEAIQEENNYARTRELASEPPAVVRSGNAPISGQSLTSAGDGIEHKETKQRAHVEAASIPIIAPPQKKVAVAEPKAAQHDRNRNERSAPSIKTLDAVGTPLPVRLALFTAILIAIIGISVLAYRNRFSNRTEGAQPPVQSSVNAAGAKVEAKEPAPDESKLNKLDGDKSLDKQPGSVRQPAVKSGAPKKKNYLRSKKAARRGSGYKARVSSRNVYRNH
jgi:serine/threonine protein kinase